MYTQKNNPRQIKPYLKVVEKTENGLFLCILLDLAADGAEVWQRHLFSRRDTRLPAAALLTLAENLQLRPHIPNLRFAERPAIVIVGENKRDHRQSFPQTHVLHTSRGDKLPFL